MQTLQRLYAKLRLRINESKSAVARPWDRAFLGYSYTLTEEGEVTRRISDKSLARMKARIRITSGRHRGRSLPSIVLELAPYLRGWRNYFQLEQRTRVLPNLDAWIRRRLRAIQLKHWKTPATIYRELRKRGLTVPAAHKVAGNARRWWKSSARKINVALPISYFDGLGLPRLAPNLNSPNRLVRTRMPGGVGGA